MVKTRNTTHHEDGNIQRSSSDSPREPRTTPSADRASSSTATSFSRPRQDYHRPSHRSGLFGIRRRKSSPQPLSKSSLPKDIRSLVGKYKPTTITQSEIRDSFGQLILQPPQMTTKNLISALSSETRDTRDNNHGSLLPSFQSLPLLNASVLLDPQHYIKASASASTSRSGTESARRLLRGRREWMSTIRKHAERGLNPPSSSSSNIGRRILSSSSSSNNNSQQHIHMDQRRAAYRLTGHGVPQQLLQNHVDFAGQLMAQHDATSLALPSKDWMRLRTKDGSVQTLPMSDGFEEHSLNLYLAVMERMARTLSIVLHRGPILTTPVVGPKTGTTSAVDSNTHQMSASAGYIEQSGSTATSFSGSSNNDDAENHRREKLSPIWHMELTRGWAVAEPVLQNQVEVEPVVEWIWPRQICIRLRGRTTDTNMAVALAYDAISPPLQDWRT